MIGFLLLKILSSNSLHRNLGDDYMNIVFELMKQASKNCDIGKTREQATITSIVNI